MSKGVSGLFRGTRGERAVSGSVDYMDPNDDFSRYMRNRRDVDVDGFYDVIAHGSPHSIEIFHNGRKISVSHRVLANLLKRDEHYKGKAIRLLSCSTGSDAGHFAQDLANKLGVPVKAPTEILWAWSTGRHSVAKGLNGSVQLPDASKPGHFKTFYPRKGKQ